MGFFSGIRRRIKKLIPKEVRPYVPYIAAAIPGMGPFASTALKGYGAAANSFLTASAAKGLTDDEADLKDIFRTGALAAAPQAIGQGLGQFGEAYGSGAERFAMGDPSSITEMTRKKGILETLGNAATEGSKSNYLNPQFEAGQLMDTAKVVGTQGAIDYGIKAAELNEDALADYNRQMLESGVNDKAGRRAAIRQIYANTGTWDMDEVDSMLDTYGYRTGGRVGYAEGDMVLTEKSMVTPEQQMQIEGNRIAEQAYNDILYRFYEKFPGVDASEMSIEDIVAELQAEKVFEQEGLGILGLDRSMDMITPESVRDSSRRIMMGDTQYGDIGSMKEQPETEYERRVKAALGLRDGGETERERRKRKREEFDEGFDYAVEGLDSLEALEDKYKPMPIRELRLQDGGSVDDRLMERVKELQDEGLDFASAMAQAMKESMASGKSRGGIMDGIDVNMKETINTPMGNETVDVNSMEEIKGQTAGPDWYMDRLQHLEFLGYNYETAGEIAYDTDRYMKVIEMDIAPGPGEGDDDYARGGRVGRAEGGMMAGADSSLMDAYEIYKFDMMEQGLEPMSIEQFREQAIAESKMASMKSGRTMAAQGGLMNLGGKEMDLRGGGFVPMGAKERADDVPARLSKNEFVMTADAVRAAGGGSVQKGADLM